MHWSLIVVCNPGFGNTLLDSGSSNTPLNCAMDMLPPCILHMDSLSGIHNTELIANLVIAYLEEEKKSAILSGTNSINETEYIVIDGRSFVSA